MVVEPTFSRGDIWSVDFGSNPADPEQAFGRPALLVSNDRLHRPSLRMVVVVPGTSRQRSIPLHVTAEPDDDNGLTEPTAFQVEQVRSISTTRLRARIGRLDAVSRAAVDEVLRSALDLS